MTVLDFYIPVLRCWACAGEGADCIKCGKTGSVFWVDGRAFPYSPEGEKQAREAQKRAEKSAHT